MYGLYVRMMYACMYVWMSGVPCRQINVYFSIQASCIVGGKKDRTFLESNPRPLAQAASA